MCDEQKQTPQDVCGEATVQCALKVAFDPTHKVTSSAKQFFNKRNMVIDKAVAKILRHLNNSVIRFSTLTVVHLSHFQVREFSGKFGTGACTAAGR